jgi:uncharacterized protein YndB with AHSA1/START domain
MPPDRCLPRWRRAYARRISSDLADAFTSSGGAGPPKVAEFAPDSAMARSNVAPKEAGMAQFSETVDINRPPEEVWRVLGEPERWFDGYLETRSRSPEYPASDTRNDHLYRTRMKEQVEVRVTRSEAPTLLEETQQGRTFARRVRYSLSPVPEGTLLRLEDNIVFKGLGKLAAPIASRDVRNRWATSLERLKAAVEARE